MKTLRDWFEDWSMREAQWWQFWLPQSGHEGGLLGAAILVIAVLAFSYLVK